MAQLTNYPGVVSRAIAEHLDYVGVFALELFVRDGKRIAWRFVAVAVALVVLWSCIAWLEPASAQGVGPPPGLDGGMLKLSEGRFA